MKRKNGAIQKRKKLILNFLCATTIVIMFLGIYFSIFSFVNDVSIKVLNASIPGYALGFMVLYLGLRYYVSADKLKNELYKDSSNFSWSNFKKRKSNKFSL